MSAKTSITQATATYDKPIAAMTLEPDASFDGIITFVGITFTVNNKQLIICIYTYTFLY